MRKNLIWTVALSVLSFTNAMADCELSYGTYYKSDGTLGAQVSPKNRSNCTGDIVIEETVTLGGKTYNVSKIDSAAFRDLPDITSVTIKGNAMEEIRNSAFNGCSGLKTINLPDSITSIESYAFKNTGLEMTDLHLPNSLTTLGQSIFVGTNITGSLVIPENVTYIGYNAFYGLTGITDVTFNNKDTLNFESWSSFSNTGKVIINGNIQAYSGAFDGAHVTEIEIADGVTNIGIRTFYGVQGLTSIIIPDSLNMEYMETQDWWQAPFDPRGKTIYMSDAKKEWCRQNLKACGLAYVGPSGVSFDDLDIRPIPDYTYDAESKLYQSGGLYYQSLSDIINNKPYSPTTQVADGFGHYAVYDKTTGKYLGMVDANGNPWRRRIYTVEEAAAVSKDTGNTIKLRYK